MIFNPKTNSVRFCECYEVEIANNRLAKSGVSESFRQKRINNFETKNKSESIKKARNVAVDYIESFEGIRNTRRNSILLTGQPGSGKTHLCMAITNKLLDDGCGVFYMPYREEMPVLKQAMCARDNEGNFVKAIKKFKDIAVLYIDDLFKGKITESDKNIMFELINHRYLKQLPIIISTEYTTGELIDIDEAIGSRIVEMSRNFIVEIPRDKALNYRLR
jgi:DNA replication protein DnaC